MTCRPPRWNLQKRCCFIAALLEMTNEMNEVNRAEQDRNAHVTSSAGGRYGAAPRAGYLGLLVDEDSLTVRRQGKAGRVEFGGRRLGWEIFRALFNKRDMFFLRKYASDIWIAAGLGEILGESTIDDAMSDVRKIIKKLDITIKTYRKLGWRLEDSSGHDRPSP